MINGNLYRDMVISAANSLDNAKEEVNGLNIFPVPDGDTGTNMGLTMMAGKREMESFSGNISDCSAKVASALLRGGRGNSGVILSLFFRGLSKGLAGKNEATATDMALAFRSGVDAAYKAVQHPTEGTILTVMRRTADTAIDISEEYTGDDLTAFFEELLETAEATLLETPEMLPVLKQANVVDAGGKGFVIILEGMLSVLRGNGIIEAKDTDYSEPQLGTSADFATFNNEDIKFGYCTECIVEKSPTCKNSAVEALSSFINGIGDSVVFLEDDEIIKFHVHTNDPGKVITESLKCGSLGLVKVENMRNQHSEIAIKEEELEKKTPEKKYGFVSVVAGDGLCEVFKDLGVDSIVSGGQTMNPSTDDIVRAVNMTPAEIVFVLPNNKNIYMAAKQAEELITDKKVIVLKTVSVPQGISALIAFDPDATSEDNKKNMKAAMKEVITAKVTFAARDSVYNDSKIKEGQILGLLENDVKVVADDKESCLKELSDNLKDTNYITLFYGEDSDEDDANKMADVLKENLGDDKEIVVVNGGQPVYYYLISAE